MVIVNFKTDLTEEELMLRARYGKLSRKRKKLKDVKSRKPEPVHLPSGAKRSKAGRDARAVAKKMIQSGLITAPKPPKPPDQSYKRPQGLERRLKNLEKPATSYQPFCPPQPLKTKGFVAKPYVKSLQESFVSARSCDDQPKVLESGDKSISTKTEAHPHAGSTIYVYGYHMTEDFLKKHFSSFGKIINITGMGDTNEAYIAFEKPAAAAQAISEMNGSTISSILLNVSLAGRQVQMDLMNDTSSSGIWSVIAAHYTARSRYKDPRKEKKYWDQEDDCLLWRYFYAINVDCLTLEFAIKRRRVLKFSEADSEM